MMIKSILVISTLLFARIVSFPETENNPANNRVWISLSCSDNVCTDNQSMQCTIEGPLNSHKNSEEILRCSCEGCEMSIESSSNVENSDAPIVNKHWADKKLWKQAAKQVKELSGSDLFQVTSIKTIIYNEDETELIFTFINETGETGDISIMVE
ncbi:MAG: hypothetical protein ACJAUV_000714 [Flavobacteriales bacterium]|jgi:hypothetical protein